MLYHVSVFDPTQRRERQFNVEATTMAEAEAKVTKAGFQSLKIEVVQSELAEVLPSDPRRPVIAATGMSGLWKAVKHYLGSETDQAAEISTVVKSYRVTVFDPKKWRERQFKVEAVSVAEAEEKAKKAGFQPRNVEMFLGKSELSLYAKVTRWLCEPVSLPSGKGKPPVQTTHGVVALVSAVIAVLGLWLVTKVASNVSERKQATVTRQSYWPQATAEHDLEMRGLDLKPPATPANKEPSSTASQPHSPQPTANHDLLLPGLDLKGQPKTDEVESTSKPPITSRVISGIGLTFDEATNGLTDLFSLEKVTPADGMDRRFGFATDKLSMLEIIGDKSNITRATLVMEMPESASGTSLGRQAATLGIFVKNMMPEWDECLTEWVLPTIQKLGENESDSTRRGSKRIKVEKVRSVGWIAIVVEPERFDSRPPATAVPVKPADQEPTSTAAGREFLRLKLAELDSFKSDPRLDEMGFAQRSPFRPWYDSVMANRDAARFSRSERIAVTDLYILGDEYRLKRGSENELTRHKRKMIEQAIRGDETKN